MKQSLKYLVFLSLLIPIVIGTTGTAMAQFASKAINNKNTEATANKAGDLNSAAADDAIAITGADETPIVAHIEAYPNPTKGMLSVKAPCEGKIFFYSQKGKEKGGCIVSEGTNLIYLQNVLNPGTYICRFEGANGSITEVRVIYEP